MWFWQWFCIEGRDEKYHTRRRLVSNFDYVLHHYMETHIVIPGWNWGTSDFSSINIPTLWVWWICAPFLFLKLHLLMTSVPNAFFTNVSDVLHILPDLGYGHRYNWVSPLWIQALTICEFVLVCVPYFLLLFTKICCCCCFPMKNY